VLEEDANRHFDLPFASPHMLYFARVRSRELKAVTHVDESARPQTVSRVENPGMYALLEVFKRLTGFGVLATPHSISKAWVHQSDHGPRPDLDVPVRSMHADPLPIPDQPGGALHAHDGRQAVLPGDHRAVGHQAPHLRHQALDRDEQGVQLGSV
jgi:hypothetical protein